MAAIFQGVFKRLHHQSPSDLEALLNTCKEKGKTSVVWKDRADIITSVLISKVNDIFKP